LVLKENIIDPQLIAITRDQAQLGALDWPQVDFSVHVFFQVFQALSGNILVVRVIAIPMRKFLHIGIFLEQVDFPFELSLGEFF
jgi:hypothetical protein